MKLSEKINYYRKQAKLSQEELAARVGVSRQSVSKWELGDATPEVDKLLTLSRAFGVTVDELLREEEPGEPPSPPEEKKETPPPASGEVRLTQKDWVRSATVLALAVCAVGLLLALGGWLFAGRASYEWVSGMLIVGLVVQLLGVLLFELAAPKMGEARRRARLRFYMIACWLVLPALLTAFSWYSFWNNTVVWMDADHLIFLSIPPNIVVTAALAGAAKKRDDDTP